MLTTNDVFYLAQMIGMKQPPQSWVDKGGILNKIHGKPDYLSESYLREALKFYRLDQQSEFVELFYDSLKQIQRNEAFQKLVGLCHEVLFGEKEPDLEKLWSWKIDFKRNVPKMFAAIILLGGYQKHLDLMRQRQLDDKQMAFQRDGVKECCLKSITFYNVQEMEASSLAWGLYHVYQRLIRVGCFNYEYGRFDEPYHVYENTEDFSLMCVADSTHEGIEHIEKQGTHSLILSRGDDRIGIHIPVGADLSLPSIYQSLKQSQDEIRAAFPVFKDKRIVYTCHSWMLSPQLDGMLNANANILRFKNLFTPLPCDDGPGDFLKFVFKKQKSWTDWAALDEDTTLRRVVKKHLMGHKVLTCGKGVMVYRQKEM